MKDSAAVHMEKRQVHPVWRAKSVFKILMTGPGISVLRISIRAMQPMDSTRGTPGQRTRYPGPEMEVP